MGGLQHLADLNRAIFILLRLRAPPRSTPFPCTTLFRSHRGRREGDQPPQRRGPGVGGGHRHVAAGRLPGRGVRDRKSTRLNSSHVKISYAVSCLKKKKKR